MAKAIQFVAGKLKFAAALTKIDRDKVYGFIEVKVNDDKGKPCIMGSLLDDGRTLVLNGATAIKTVDALFNELDKKELKVVYQDGKDAVLVPSSYEGEVNLIETTLDDLFNLEEILKKEDTLFIIIKDEINETLTNELKHIWESDGIFIVIENIKRLQFNILDHELVPEHTIVPESEVVNIMKKYNITDKIQFPDISRFDPVARAIGLRPGQLCHIVRPSKTAIEADYYRICI